MSLHLKWLAPASFKKGLDFQELIAFILPTTYAYYDGLPKVIDCSRNVIIITTVLVFVLLFLFKVYKKFIDGERSVSEVLETGYFNNFFRPFAARISDRGRSGEKTTIDFRDKTQSPVTTGNIALKIILPESKDKLAETLKQIDSITRDAMIDGSWVKAQITETGRVTILECPRTLATISHYLDNGAERYTDEESVRFHRYFTEKYMRDYNAASFSFEVVKG
ncbi:MAG TPA: STING domain-containing protein [Mucilaginibacter sp.]|nr:STING domain-containing protein [Mucilaginibacter sp.]